MQLQLFKGHFLITQASMDEEAIHQMRVAIKRIRTIQKLKKHINFPTVIDDDQYRAIKKIFSVSGELRDIQVQLDMLKKYKKELRFSFAELFGYLKSKKQDLTDQLNKTISEIDFSQFDELTDPGTLEVDLDGKADLERQSKDFLKRKVNKLQRLILFLDQEDFVHDLRKQVKQLFFILQFLASNFPESPFADFQLKKLKTTGEKLGQWNDRDVFKCMLGKFVSKQEDDFLYDHAEYQILFYVLKDEKQRLLSGIDLDLYMELTEVKVRMGYVPPEAVPASGNTDATEGQGIQNAGTGIS